MRTCFGLPVGSLNFWDVMKFEGGELERPGDVVDAAVGLRMLL